MIALKRANASLAVLSLNSEMERGFGRSLLLLTLAVRINGFPLRSTALDMVNILADFGFEVGRSLA
jgi:hypothetical protein